jgi:DNA replication and repair protein RecF
LAEHLSIVWLTPAMDRLFMDGAGGRRRFLDRLTLALSPSHAVHASRYEAAMRSRNKLLAQGRNADPQWMSALEAQMQEHGSALSHARAQLVLHLNAVLADVPDAPFARPGIAITGAIGEEHAGLADYLREGRGRDAAAGRTLIGPHRADISVTHKAKDQAAALCSTGEQKALLLSILLAHAQLIADKRGAPPVLLLDEIAAHIDPVRRLALFERLRGTGSQVWMTGTEAGLFDEIGPASLLRVENGQVLQISL